MRLTITPKAAKWFENELDLSKGDSVKFYGKYGGTTNVHVGFSTGIAITEPLAPLLIEEINGIAYFIETDDDCFFSDYHLIVDIDAYLDEPSYTYE